MENTSKAKLNLVSQACADVKGKGGEQLTMSIVGGQRLIEFQNTVLLPKLHMNVISVVKIAGKGHIVTFFKDGTYACNANGADRKGNVYYVRCPNTVLRTVEVALSIRSSKLGVCMKVDA